MKKILFLLILIISLIGCRTVKPPEQPPVLKDSVRIVEKLVPVTIPADSSTLVALLECDSANKVILKELSETKTKRVQTAINFSPGTTGKLSYKSTVKPDTVYIRGKDITIYKEKPVYIPSKPIVTNELTWWQKLFLWGGVAFYVLLAIAIYKQINPFIKKLWKH